MKSVIFVAPPSSGKGTQSKKLEELGYNHISTGDLLRKEIQKGSDLGKQIEKILAAGDLVNDDIVFTLIKDLLKDKERPFILDGFPRTIKQAKMLNDLFNDLQINNYEVIYLDISLEEALKRVLGRLTCSCGASYNLNYDFLKPKKENICDKCGSHLVKRDDDNEESFKLRFQTFENNIKPIKEFYNKLNKLHIVNALMDNDVITKEIRDILK